MPSLGSRSTNGDFNASTHPWCANTYFVTSQRYLWTAGLAPPSAKLPAGLLQGFGFLLLSGLLAASPGNYRTAFAIAILPGLVAAASIAIVVQERARSPVSHAFFSERLGLLPSAHRRLLLAVGIFGAGAFAHTLLILLATQRPTPSLGVSGAATAAVAPTFYTMFSMQDFPTSGGLLADRFP